MRWIGDFEELIAVDFLPQELVVARVQQCGEIERSGT